jgi:hypothetical protein
MTAPKRPPDPNQLAKFIVDVATRAEQSTRQPDATSTVTDHQKPRRLPPREVLCAVLDPARTARSKRSSGFRNSPVPWRNSPRPARPRRGFSLGDNTSRTYRADPAAPEPQRFIHGGVAI